MSTTAGPERQRCPQCGAVSPARLLPGQVCAACESVAAWSRQDRLVISHADVDEAVARRAGEAAGETWRQKARLLGPTAVAAVLAAVSIVLLARLLGGRELGPLAELLAAFELTAIATTGVGGVTLLVAVIAFRRLRRSRLFRAWAPLVLCLASFSAAAAATLIGTLHLFVAGGFDLDFLEVPERTALGILPPEVERIVNATAVIQAPAADGDALTGGLGSGAVVYARGDTAWVITCSHVAMPYVAVAAQRDPREAQPVWVTFSDGRAAIGHLRWVAPPPLDVALVEVRIEDPPEPVPVAPDSEALRPGEPVMYVPLPLRHGWIVHHGQVTLRQSHDTPAGQYTLLFTDLPVLPGDSGTGLFDAEGVLVGLNTWTRLGFHGPQGISLPSESMEAIVKLIDRDELGPDQYIEGRPK